MVEQFGQAASPQFATTSTISPPAANKALSSAPPSVVTSTVSTLCVIVIVSIPVTYLEAVTEKSSGRWAEAAATWKQDQGTIRIWN